VEETRNGNLRETRNPLSGLCLGLYLHAIMAPQELATLYAQLKTEFGAVHPDLQKCGQLLSKLKVQRPYEFARYHSLTDPFPPGGPYPGRFISAPRGRKP
jgi:hypothetical protein